MKRRSPKPLMAHVEKSEGSSCRACNRAAAKRYAARRREAL